MDDLWTVKRNASDTVSSVRRFSRIELPTDPEEAPDRSVTASSPVRSYGNIPVSKLKSLKPRLPALASRFASQASTETISKSRYRDESLHYRKWYKTARWQQLRMEVLTRDKFTCQMVGCGKVTGKTSQLVCDHIQPHRGNERLFWDLSNLQCLCKPCHDRLKQRQEQSSLHTSGVWD